MNIKARIAYAMSLTKELEYAQAIEQFSEVLKYIPDNADTMYNIALAYELIGDYERAIKYYKNAIDTDPEHKEANHNIELLLGKPYEKQNFKEETTKEQEEIIEPEIVNAQTIDQPNEEELIQTDENLDLNSDSMFG